MRDDSWIKKTAENSFNDTNTSRYEIQINDSKNSGVDAGGPSGGDRRIDQSPVVVGNCGGKGNGQGLGSYGWGKGEDKENAWGGIGERAGKGKRGGAGKNIQEEKIMNAIRKKIHNL